jgi:hypothetical protein
VNAVLDVNVIAQSKVSVLFGDPARQFERSAKGVGGLIMSLEPENRIEATANWRQRTKRLPETKFISKIAAFEMDAVRKIRNKVASEGAQSHASMKMFMAAPEQYFPDQKPDHRATSRNNDGGCCR